MIIYADLVLAINILMNSLILWLTAVATGVRFTAWRIGLAAVAGSVYVLLGAVQELSMLYSPLAKVFVSASLVFITFGYISLRLFLFQVGAFYFVSFLLGGAVLGWLFFWEDHLPLRQGEISLNWINLAVGSLVGAGLAVALTRRCISRMYRKKTLYELHIEYRGKKAAVMAMLDTGNGLYTIVGRKPVIPVEVASLMPLLSSGATRFLSECAPEEWLGSLDSCNDAEWLSRVEVVPYRSVGAASMLLAFRPDSITVFTEAGLVIADHVAIAIYSGCLSSEGRYQALLHPGLFETAKYQREANVCA